MSEYRVNDLTVCTTPEGEIEITQRRFTDNGEMGVFIFPSQVNQLIEFLQSAARDIEEQGVDQAGDRPAAPLHNRS